MKPVAQGNFENDPWYSHSSGSSMLLNSVFASLIQQAALPTKWQKTHRKH